MGKMDSFVVGMRDISWPGFTKKWKWFCRTTVTSFAFVLGWQLCSVSVWWFWSASARLSCQEIRPTQCTFIAKNYVKFSFLCFISLGFFQFFFFFPRVEVLLPSLLCQDLMLPFLFWQDQPDFVLPRTMYITAARDLTALLSCRVVF